MAIVGLNHFTVLTHDLEACKALGETTVKANLVQAAKH